MLSLILNQYSSIRHVASEFGFISHSFMVNRFCITNSISRPDTTLKFESRFESGNLLDAVQVSEFEYDLRVRPDLFTENRAQWFYFRVQV